MKPVEMPMSLLDRVLGPASRPLGLDEDTLLRLERTRRRVEPDPLFRRRLRGHVVNRYVAAREGMLTEPRPRRQMGKLGRSVLLASLAATLSVSAAGAAAQDSIPGDPLYGVKLQLEELRMRIAPPTVRAELAAIALAERVEELELLAAAGAWVEVPQAVVRLTEARQELIALDPEARARAALGELGAVAALEAVMAKAPPEARHGLERALLAIGPPASSGGQRTGKPLDTGNAGATGRPATGSGAAPGATHSANPRSEETGKPSRSPAPSPSGHLERGSTGQGSTSSE